VALGISITAEKDIGHKICGDSQRIINLDTENKEVINDDTRESISQRRGSSNVDAGLSAGPAQTAVSGRETQGVRDREGTGGVSPVFSQGAEGDTRPLSGGRVHTGSPGPVGEPESGTGESDAGRRVSEDIAGNHRIADNSIISP